MFTSPSSESSSGSEGTKDEPSQSKSREVAYSTLPMDIDDTVEDVENRPLTSTQSVQVHFTNIEIKSRFRRKSLRSLLSLLNTYQIGVVYNP